ncbi:MAG: 4-hydroxythreonine-4-phosphate dehydrogenase PdxA [Elusimicrobia bacterium]|nr:4-hydroxythreonine-4-phosphate dehydrogenase PdxA [Elusimicrobiota bacterium]MBU2615055.1 4-hydroxythreonine-4-phosphate dehydrogenase PdxA [Elusimicrobiota bacterium]
MNEFPLVIITTGDPSGIGPEITVKSFIEAPELFKKCIPLIVGDYSVLKQFLNKSRVKYTVNSKFIPEKISKNTLNIVDLAVLKNKTAMGVVSGTSGAASIDYLNFAVNLLTTHIIKKPNAFSLVTGPISKESVIKSGIQGFSGHTEYLAEKTCSKQFAMLMASEKYKVLLATRHIALKKVPGSISKKLLTQQVLTVIKTMRDYLNIRPSEIIMCALNPHCGESGHIGKEEEKIIIPAILELKKRNLNISGPIAAEYAFSISIKNDLIVCQYHDQAMAPLRLLCGMKFVNITCGLPFLRVSPAHGTAFDIAGKNCADPSSMMEAIKFASGSN